MIYLRSRSEIGTLRQAGRIVAEVLNSLESKIRPGVTTRTLDQWAEKLIRERKATPSFKGYQGYPATLCTSVNDQVVHGIPDSRVLKSGDIISVDVGANFNGWHGDAARTYAVGEVAVIFQQLMKVTKEALEIGIAEAKVGKHLSNIGHAIQQHVEAANFSIVRDFVGHGIGREVHEDPQIPNFGKPNQGVILKAGMILAIEPMVNVGAYPVRVLDDNWTAVTQDQSRSAHFEHTIAILDSGAEVLTV
ncbi:type I methionyl aminopeptidase [bacterium]|nr:type I methionyl aminopeptidase [bacterium]